MKKSETQADQSKETKDLINDLIPYHMNYSKYIKDEVGSINSDPDVLRAKQLQWQWDYKHKSTTK